MAKGVTTASLILRSLAVRITQKNSQKLAAAGYSVNSKSSFSKDPSGSITERFNSLVNIVENNSFFSAGDGFTRN